MTGPEEPDNLTSMESATETIKRIFEGSTSPVGAQIADESTRNRPGFDSMKNRYVSMSGAVKRPVNPGHKILVGENNYALAA